MAERRATALSEAFRKSLAAGAVRVRGGALSERDLEAACGRLGGRVCAREAVGFSFENGADCLLAYMALAEADAVAVPLPPAMPEAERLRLWRALGCRWALSARGLAALEGAAEPAAWPADVHWVVHSSGSTGVPKAIPLTWTAVAKNARDTMEALGLGTDLLHLGSMSQCYTNGLFNSFLLPLITGGRALCGPVAGALKLAEYIELARAERPQVLWINPMVLTFLLRRARPEDLAAAKVLVSCTAPLSLEECLAGEKFFRKPVLQSYGLSETLIVSVEEPDRDAAREFSAGVAVGGPAAVSTSADGVLRVHNGAVFPGYARREGRGIAFSLPAGEAGKTFVSGDLARLEGGRLTITGRLTQVINVGGVKVSPEQLEAVLREQPGVRAAVVVGRPHGDSERPAALVEGERSLDAAALADACAERLGPQARPAFVRIVEKVPLTANGKLDRPAAARRLDEEARP